MRDSSSNLSNVAAAHEVPVHQAFHLVGIGGAGMSVVAQLLHDLGYSVSGSDSKETETLAQLRELGIRVFVGHAAGHISSNMIVVASSAIREENPEIRRAQELGLEIWHRSQALEFCTRSHNLVAVAGAHGKTTTSAMIAATLREIGANPSFAIGGVIAKLHTGAQLGGSTFVIEADESDGSFLNYSPLVEVLTNIEPDHLDHWGSSAALEDAFVRFTRCLRTGGVIVACGDDEGIRRVAGCFQSGGLISYGFDSPLPNAETVVALDSPELGAGKASARVRITGGQPAHEIFAGVLRLNVGGRHELLDAAGALGAVVALNQAVGAEVDLAKFCAGLEQYTGAKRRMEFLGEVEGVRIYDDYGHHPTEIAATLQAARDLAEPGRLLVCFQPHLYSRTLNFAHEFAQVLSRADDVVVCGVYAARENPEDGANGDVITDLMGNKARFIADMYQAGDAAFASARRGDLLLFLGAGSITHVGHDLVQKQCNGGVW